MTEHASVNQKPYMLLVLVLIPIFVVLAAFFVFYTGIGMPKDTRNKGVLIAPPQQINDIQSLDIQGKSFVFERKKEESRWTFLTAHSATCNDECKQRFWMKRQTRIALGQYQEKVRRVWLVTEGRLDDETERWLQKEHADVVVLYGDNAKWQQLLGQSNYRVTDENQTNFFLVDPDGFVMMYYTMQNTYKDIMTDMKFLIKDVD